MKVVTKFKQKNKIALVRSDFNVPIKNKKISDDKRIRESLPTIKYLLKLKSKIVLMAHLGRPGGKYAEEFSLKPVAKRLEKLLKKKVQFIEKPLSEEVKDIIDTSKDSIFLLENIRFYKQEKKNDKKFAEDLSKLADIYVNDAFGTAHRAHASTEAITHYLPSYAGLLLEKEIKELSKALRPKRPLVVIIGGKKVSDKIGVIKNFLTKAKYVLIGGAMCFTFLKAQGYDVGKSLVEKDSLTLAKFLLKKGKNKIVLPVDVITASKIDSKAKASIHTIADMPKNELGLDIGPATTKLFSSMLKDAKTIVWNGSMGVNEIKQFAKGTAEVGKALAKSKAITIVGGGDTISAVDKLKIENKLTHVSTGGGASLEFLEGKNLPAIKALK